ncbi:unnamed protein product [Rangifer tarandus platyrhynchus]|uniref:Uncharacterized protein n=1 Tax=Rangifer tarandus platyrhynchus TaxID=3082113 RepID=A0ABN9A6Q9_RANTA|nr:unnamed protein product [Rangifer tarandus platyrhynchus]
MLSRASLQQGTVYDLFIKEQGDVSGFLGPQGRLCSAGGLAAIGAYLGESVCERRAPGRSEGGGGRLGSRVRLFATPSMVALSSVYGMFQARMTTSGSPPFPGDLRARVSRAPRSGGWILCHGASRDAPGETRKGNLKTRAAVKTAV